MIGTMFSKVLDLGNHIGKVWNITVSEGLKEVLWKEMNGALVLGHRYHGMKGKKSDMGRVCSCGMEMLLGHILLGCSVYKLQPLLDILTDTLTSISLKSSFRTLHPDEWGSTPWYPLLALKTLEESTLPIFKGRKELLRQLKASRHRREWIIGSYYWSLWKWRMKEIHDDKFRFIPFLCAGPLRTALLQPCLVRDQEEPDGDAVQTLAAKTRLTDSAYG